MHAIDSINRRLDTKNVVLASEGMNSIMSSSEHRSPRYTTHWAEIPVVKIK